MSGIPSPSTSPKIHGLSYPTNFLHSLKVLTPRPSPHQPIRLLPLSHFCDIHLRSTLSHAPDGVLFPFLHGLEGSNQAQNTFFASTMGGRWGGGGGMGVGSVPRFRGLVWVVCEEDLEDDKPVPVPVPVPVPTTPNYEEMDDLEDDFYSSEDESSSSSSSSAGAAGGGGGAVDLEAGEGSIIDDMDVTAAISDLSEMEFAMDVDDGDADRAQQSTSPTTTTTTYMHPVHHRSPPSISTSTAPGNPHDNHRRPSNASIASTTTTTSHSSISTED